MRESELVFIISDEPDTLTAIATQIQQHCDLNYLAVSRYEDLKILLSSVHPIAVIVVCQRDQAWLMEILRFLEGKSIPVLCLSASQFTYHPSSPQSLAIFGMPLENAMKGDILCSWIKSLKWMLPSQDTLGEHARPENDQQLPDRTNPNENNLPFDQFGRYMLELEQKQGILQRIRTQIMGLSSQTNDHVRSELKTIASTIKGTLSRKQYWEDFKILFNSQNPGFMARISDIHPSLTPTDFKYCCYLFHNLSNNDISNILGISLESVRTHKYRLKKKMSLGKDQELTNYLRSLSPAN